MTLDSRFAGSIPDIYEQCLVPVLFRPYAIDLAARAARLAPAEVLELAAGTGVVTEELASTLPQARIVATDLNPAMLEVARSRRGTERIEFLAADAQALPFADGAFDLVVAQFGAMFFPDKVAAYRNARRVLRKGGAFLFNVWDRLDANSGSAAIHRAVCEAVPAPRPEFIARTPFGYHEAAVIESELRQAGFGSIEVERVERSSPSEQAGQLARGMCQGSPLANELAVHPPAVREAALAAATEAVEGLGAVGPLTMSALVICARG